MFCLNLQWVLKVFNLADEVFAKKLTSKLFSRKRPMVLSSSLAYIMLSDKNSFLHYQVNLWVKVFIYFSTFYFIEFKFEYWKLSSYNFLSPIIQIMLEHNSKDTRTVYVICLICLRPMFYWIASRCSVVISEC